MKPAIALFAGASIVGCAVQDQTVTEINAAEWLDREREFAYIHHTFTGHNDGIVRPTSAYSASGIDIYRRTVETDGFGERELLYRRDAVLPCGEMIFRPEDASLAQARGRGMEARRARRGGQPHRAGAGIIP